ncbi:MAG: Holliday junction resolvase RuvX [Patescibacteria group bacterium]
MKYLGIDYGTKRIGVAVSDDEGRVAFPLMVMESGAQALSAVAALAQKNNVQKIVIGESRNLHNEPNPVMEDIEQFKKDLEELTKLPVAYQQEFFTSTEAARQFAPQDSRKANPVHEALDASAAALILQSYLDSKK